jgi:hypothetical protein
MSIGKILEVGKKFASLGSGNPATIATAFAPEDSPFSKAASAGMAFAGAGGGLKGLGAAASQGDSPMSRAMAMKTQIDGLGAEPATPTDVGSGQLGAMRKRRGF